MPRLSEQRQFVKKVAKDVVKYVVHKQLTESYTDILINPPNELNLPEMTRWDMNELNVIENEVKNQLRKILDRVR